MLKDLKYSRSYQILLIDEPENSISYNIYVPGRTKDKRKTTEPYPQYTYFSIIEKGWYQFVRLITG